jgi:hypothetical protein
LESARAQCARVRQQAEHNARTVDILSIVANQAVARSELVHMANAALRTSVAQARADIERVRLEQAESNEHALVAARDERK